MERESGKGREGQREGKDEGRWGGEGKDREG